MSRNRVQDGGAGRTDPFVAPRRGVRVDDCYFYHSMNVPGVGPVEGEWDLRGRVDEYLGHVNLAGKRVLEIGAASGFLTVEMEKRGAHVVAFDLAADAAWDGVPYRGRDDAGFKSAYRGHVARIHNGFWLAHEAFGSAAQVVHGTVYDVPEAIGRVDVATFGCVLLHLRDPFQALRSALRLTAELAIVTELARPAGAGEASAPYLLFCPDAASETPRDTWWYLSPAFVTQALAVLGFGEAQVVFHGQRQTGIYARTGRDTALYTVVARRTHPLPRD